MIYDLLDGGEVRLRFQLVEDVLILLTCIVLPCVFYSQVNLYLLLCNPAILAPILKQDE